MAAVRDLRSWSRKQSAPATVVIVGLMIISSIYWWAVHQKGIELFMHTSQWTSRPWQLVTYPFAYDPLSNSLTFICFVLTIAWMIYAGMTIERELGTVRFVVFWIVMSILPALLIGIYANIRGFAFGFGGPFLPVDAVAIAWCTRFATTSVLVYGFIPMSGKWLAWLSAAMVFFLYGAILPEFGFLATLPLILPWMYASNRVPNLAWGKFGGKTNMQAAKATEKRDKSYYDDVRKREQERVERERLRKLFESSMGDDPEK